MEENNSGKNEERSGFGLLKTKRFAPFFWTQFFGAFNDNVFKQALIIFITYKASEGIAAQSDLYINLSAGLFILPFLLFSAFAGQLADKYEKSMLMRYIKILEICIMILGAISFYFQSVPLLILILFLMGTQSTFFGPIKYSVIPQHLNKAEITGGNAMVEMGTFVAILLGTIAGGNIINFPNGELYVGLAVIVFAIIGWLTSIPIPKASSSDPDLKIDLNFFTQTIRTIQIARENKVVFLSVLGNSWFWMLGAAYLTQMANFNKVYLFSQPEVYTLILSIFSIGIGAGSLLCEYFSGKTIEFGLVPIGSIGLSIFGIDLYFAGLGRVPTGELLNIVQFLSDISNVRVLIDFFLIGIFGGFYIVPLYAIIQTRSREAVRSRVIAATNIINALFMVLAAVAGIIILTWLKFTIPQFFLIFALCNIIVAVYIYSLVPEFTMRCIVWLLTHLIYRIKHKDLEHIPKEGPVVLVSNHISYMDGLILAGVCRRPARFVMGSFLFQIPVLSFLMRTAKGIPITSKDKDPEIYNKAFESINTALSEDELLCIFPEGALTPDGDIGEFKKGIEKIVQTNPKTVVVPVALRGLWGSFFSHSGQGMFKGFLKRVFSRVDVFVGAPVTVDSINAEDLRKRVLALRGNKK
ncbi:MAG: MFS transporter [Desulfobacterales bacterium]|nr:MFS transporter [Desulfobacterales bacterium]MCP4160648.1 MFS transporter [Deltaproteobacteria bacterium]